MRTPSKIQLVAIAFTIAGAQQAQAQVQIRFQGMDRNRDGVITRDEWQGNDSAFRNEDWDGDGVLSGEEVRTGGNRRGGSQGRGAANARFISLDVNRDGWIVRREWTLDRSEFNKLDANRDRRISRLEFGDYSVAPPSRSDVTNAPRDRFSIADRDRSGYLIPSEWSWEDAWFKRIDTNRDNRVNRAEFDAATSLFDEPANRYRENGANQPNRQKNRAAQEGFARGRIEGRQAGQEERMNRRAWDLDGQTELERADSGYSAQFGSLADYQAGYRDGFREAYREGYNSR